MGRVRRVLGWVFVRGPAAAYALADSGSPLVGFAAVVGMALAAGVGAGIGALAGLLRGRPVGDAALAGGMVGLGAVVAWLVLTLVVVAVLWARGVSPAEVATGKTPVGRHAAATNGWRRRGQPLVPGSLVAFFAIMTIFVGADGVYSWHVSRPPGQVTATLDGKVTAENEAGWFERGSGSADVRYSVGGVSYTIRTTRDPGDHFLRVGDDVPVTYVVADPARARGTWALQSARDDLLVDLVLGGGCGGLGLLTGVGYLAGRLRSTARRAD